MKDIKIYSFFSGLGFLDLGFELSGYNISFVNEYNESFINAYKFARKNMNLKKPVHGYYCGSIDDLLRGNKKKELQEYIAADKKNGIVGFIGGPPCPDFSIAGKNKGIIGENGRLTNSYKRAILMYEPDFFVFENVKGLVTTKKHKEVYDKIKRSFVRKGYVLTERLVNSLEYGVPQERERIILFGIKYCLLSDRRTQAKKILHQNFSWGNKEQFSIEKINACNWPINSPFEVDGFLPKPTNIIEELTLEYWFKKNKTETHYNCEDYFIPHSINRFNSIMEGDICKKSFKRLHRWRYSPTAAYGNNEVHLHPYKARRLTVAEALAIQSAPSEFILPKTMTKSEMFKSIGNGVPYLLSKSLAECIRIFISGYLL